MIERFQFHAFATGLGGHIFYPFDEIIPVQACAALPESGGFGAMRVENFRFRDIVSFTSATSTVAGSYSQKDKTWDSLATVTIEGLNILGMVTADRIVARIASAHPDDREAEPSITPLGSYYENLRIAGYPVRVHLATGTFAKFDTSEKVRAAYDDNCDGFRDEFDQLSFTKGAVPEKGRRSTCTLARAVEGLGSELYAEKGIIRVPGFGTVHLAEFKMTQHARRINMLHVELGSTPAGRVTGGGAEGNGEPWP